MIVRSVVCSLVLALPLVAPAQSYRATPDLSGAEAPVIRVWIPNSLNFSYGQQVPVSFEVSEASHVAIFRIDGRGRMQVLWPQRNSLQTAAQSGREYRVSSPYSPYGAFAADYELGQGMVIAIASPDPIELSAFRRYRNDQNFYHYAYQQRPYTGGVGSIVDRLSQEILYASDSPYDFDVAFYSSAGGSRYSALCSGHYRYPRWGWTTYSAWFAGSIRSLGYLDDCYGRPYGGYLAYCNGWNAFYGYFDAGWCRFGNPWWQSVPGPIAGTPQPQPRPSNADMIDTIMSRPVAIERNNGDQSASGGTSGGNGTTKVVYMEPVRDGPNGTRWLTADENEAISLPARFRRESTEPSRGGVGVNTREEGFARSPVGGVRADDPRDTRPGRTPGTAFMPPVREPARPTVWRDNRDNGGSQASPRWQRPTLPQPTHPGGSSGGQIDRGSTSTGSSAPSAGSAAPTVTPRTDASVTKTDAGGSKASDTKTTGERKPQ